LLQPFNFLLDNPVFTLIYLLENIASHAVYGPTVLQFFVRMYVMCYPCIGSTESFYKLLLKKIFIVILYSVPQKKDEFISLLFIGGF
jgi:hypothetical protein